MKKLLFLIALACLVIPFIGQSVASQKENMILANIEMLVKGEDGVKTRSCYMDKDIIEDLSAASKYTTCNEQTTSTTMYKCGKDKQGNFEKYTTPTSYKCMY